MYKPGCKAIRCNEQMQCGMCGLEWDIDDPDPPECLSGHNLHLKRMRELFKDEPPTVKEKRFIHGVGWE